MMDHEITKRQTRFHRPDFRWPVILPMICLCLLCIMAVASPVLATETRVLNIDLPSYQVRSASGIDTVSFAGSEPYMAEEGRPLVPYLVQKIQYPKGERVQNVLLVERSGQTTAAGLNLPIVLHQDQPPEPVTIKPGWFPQETHQWEVMENADGSTTLFIRIYPFFCRPDTKETVYYQKFTLAIETMLTQVDFLDMKLNKDLYAIGDQVVIDLSFDNAGPAADVIVNLVIKNTASGEIIAGLPLGWLSGLKGLASYSAVWDSGGQLADDYRLEATITDSSGAVLGYREMFLIIRDASEISRYTQETIVVPTAKASPSPAPSPSPGLDANAWQNLLKSPVVIIAGVALVLVLAIILALILKKRK